MKRWKPVEIRENPDGSLTVFLTDEHCKALGVKVGDRLVWTLSEKRGASVKKRTKRYKLKKNEYDSFVVEED